jgi:hypothetical protein
MSNFIKTKLYNVVKNEKKELALPSCYEQLEQKKMQFRFSV